MVAVGRMAGYAEPDKSYHGRSGIGEGVERVRSDRYRAGDGAHEKFCPRYQRVEHDAQRAAQRSVRASCFGRTDIVIIFYK